MSNVEKIAVFLMGILVGVACCYSYMTYKYVINVEPIEPETITVIKEVEVPVEIVREVEVPVFVPYEKPFYRNFSIEEEWYYKDLAMREAEGEGVTGMLWIMYTAECRCEAFGHSIKQEWSSSVYTSMDRSGITPNDNCNEAFELFREGWTPKPLYFRADTYHNFATPLFQYGNHYFSM